MHVRVVFPGAMLPYSYSVGFSSIMSLGLPHPENTQDIEQHPKLQKSHRKSQVVTELHRNTQIFTD